MAMVVPFQVPEVMVPTVDNEDAEVRAERVVNVLLLVAVTFAAVPVVFWLRVGKFPATAAATEVPLP
jgi:hypothetical protein